MDQGPSFDWLIIVIAAVVNMVIGYFWYSKWLFGDMWDRLSRTGMPRDKEMKSALIFAFINSLVIAFFLYFFEGVFNVSSVTDGMFVGFCAWLGFSATTSIGGVIWCKVPFHLFLIDSGCKLLSFLVMGGLIGA